MKGISKGTATRQGEGISRWTHIALIPALLLAMVEGGRTAAEPQARTDSEIRGAAIPRRGAGGNRTAVSSGWLNQVQGDLAEREYDVSWQAAPGDGRIDPSWQAPNRLQGFRTYFTREGIRVVPRTESAPSWSFGLSLAGYGRGGRSWAVPQATLFPSGHRMEYRRGAFQERYENSSRGLEQSFTLPAPPGQALGGKVPAELQRWTTSLKRTPAIQNLVHLDLQLWGDVSPRISEDGQAIDFATPSGAPALHYAQLKVTDARGATLPAWMEGYSGEERRGIRLVVDDRGASYPITLDPLTTNAAWTAESDQDSANFGFSVATAGDVNGDGFSDVIVGARYFSDFAAININEGKAYLYLGSASGLSTTPAWTAEGRQFAAAFGSAVGTAGDVNGDGYSDVIIGAPGYTNDQSGEGRAYVYLGSPSGLSSTPAWTAESDQVNAQFGNAVGTAGDVNGDGYSDVIVGDAYYSNGQSTEGRAYVYLGSPSGLSPTPVWTAESDQANAQFGISVGTAGDVNGDGYADVIVGAYGYDTALAVNAGRAYVYLGSPSGPSLTAAWIADGEQPSLFANSVGTAGDVNGDGYADVVVGAPSFTSAGLVVGRTYVFLGSAAGLASTPAWTADGNQNNDAFGYSVGTAGDINGDGYADVLVGAFDYDNGETDEGRAFVYLGSAAGLSPTPAWTAESNQPSAWFGYSTGTAGDVNGDGYADVIVGAHLFDDPQTDEGAAFVYLGSASGPATTAAWTAESDQVGASLGYSVSTAGDVNGDGYSDVIVAAPYYDSGEENEGRAYLYLGSASGLATIPAWTAESNQAFSYFSWSVATAGDVNCDGYSDVIVGALSYTNGQNEEGRAYLYLGSASGLAITPAWTAEGNQVSAEFGFSVATAGDVNGDGCADVLVGAPHFFNSVADERVYLYFGSASGLATTAAWTVDLGQVDGFLGTSLSVATAGDINGDGFSDVIVGMPDYTNGQSHEGRAFLYLGSASGLATTPAWTVEGNQAGALLGTSVATAGDVNGDGYADVIVGVPSYQSGPTFVGRAYVYLGSGIGLATTPAWTAEGDQDGANFAVSVAPAGDVNGDGYADIIVGASDFTNGQLSEGRAYLYLGSASGLSTTAAWTAESNQANAHFGNSVAPAGDVNGDGYADIIVGASDFTNGQNLEGRVFVYYGNIGGGLARIPRQARSDGTALVALLGAADSKTAFRLKERGFTPAGRSRIRLQWEVKPLGTPFNGTGLGASGVQDTGIPAASGSATSFEQAVAGLSELTFYHWRSRIVGSDPFFPRSPWMSLAGNNVTETKLRTAGCIDVDGDGYGSSGGPSCLGPIPDCNDQNAAAWGTPGETLNLRFTSDTALAWDPPVSPGAPTSALLYDVLRSPSPGNFTVASCVESDDGPNTTAVDSTIPPIGQVFFYLTRAQDGCAQGVGSLGSSSSGTPRTGVNCP